MSVLTEITRHVLNDLEKSAQPAAGGMPAGMPPGVDPAMLAAGGMPPAAMPGMPMPGQPQPQGGQGGSKGSKMEERISNLEAAVAEILKNLKMANPEQALADAISKQPGAQVGGQGAMTDVQSTPAGPMDPMAAQAMQQLKLGSARMLDSDAALALSRILSKSS